MTLNQRIYIYFSDGSPESDFLLQTISSHEHGKLISVIPVKEEARSSQVVQSLLEEDIRIETTEKGTIKHCFLVRDGGVALYPASDIEIVLAFASRK